MTFFAFLLSLSLILLVTRFSYLILCFEYFIKLSIALFTGQETAVSQFDYKTVELLILCFLAVLMPLGLFYFRNKFGFLKSQINLPVTFISILFFSLIFAPIITLQHPNFQKDISLTKLLPPFSSVDFVKLKSGEDSFSAAEDLQSLKSSVVHNPFDKSIEYIDSLSVNGSSVVLYKFLKTIEIDKQALITDEGKPEVYSKLFILGTDHLGRDVFSMLIYGSRTSIMVGIGSLIIVVIIGLSFGFIAAYWGGISDTVLSRLADIFLAFPSIFLVLLVLALFGNNLFSVIFVLGFSGWMSLFRIVKGEVLIVKEKDYILSSQLLGLSKTRILFKDILPIIASPVLVNMVIQFANIILAESTLSFLGLGVGIDYYSWGSLIQSGQEYLTKGWWMILLPGLTLVLTLFSFNSFANSLNQKFNPLLGK